MGTVCCSSRPGHLNSATATVHPALGCLRLHNRITSRIIAGQDGYGVQEMDIGTEKVDYRLNMYWTARLLWDRKVCSEEPNLCIMV